MGELTDILEHHLEETTPEERAEEWNELKTNIDIQQPKCVLEWVDRNGFGVSFNVYKDFNWFQQKMLKWCFGLTYKKL